jgi:3-oxoacyl-[acyl-carrier-protein] synthase II
MTDRSGARVFITGSGSISGGASSVEELWSFACNHERIPGSAPSDREIASLIGLSSGDLSILGRHQILALAVAEQAWSSAGLPGVRNRLRGEGNKERHSSRACVGGSSLGGFVAMERDLAASDGARISPYAVSRWRGNSVPAVVALRHGLGGAVLSLSAASATGAQILWTAGTLIRAGMADIVLGVAADSSLTPSVARAMSRNGSVATDPASAPLASNRSGMIPSEGAAAIIMESQSSARARGVEPLAEWLGGGIANECHHLQAPDPSGATLERLIAKVTEEASVESPDWVSLHATGTPRYDAVECSVLGRTPWRGGRDPRFSAFKGITGHALSASGLLEAILLTEGLRRGETPPAPRHVDASLGLRAPDPSIPEMPEHALQIAQGMGGDVVVNLLARPVP